MHPTRKKILTNLSRSESKRFNDIKSFEIDPRNFVYHLNWLIHKGFVKQDKGSSRYELTVKGKRLLTNKDLKSTQANYNLDSFIGLLVLKNEKILTVKRQQSPFLYHTGIPIFDIEAHKFIHESAMDSLRSIGLQGEINNFLMLETIYNDRHKNAITHSCMHVYLVVNPQGENIESNTEGRLKWITKDELRKIKPGYRDSEYILDELSHLSTNNNSKYIRYIYHTDSSANF